MRDVELSGWWWLPDKPARRVPGTLRFTLHEGAALWLIGELDPPRARDGVVTFSDSRGPIAWPLVHGIAHGKAVSLLGCLRGATPRDFGLHDVAVRQEVYAHAVLIGIHVESPEEAGFDGINIGMENLLAWTGQSGLGTKITQQAERITDHTLSATSLEPLTAELSDCQVGITFWHRTGFGAMTRESSSMEIRERAELTLRAGEPRSIEEWLQFHKPLQDLLTLATGRATTITHLRLRPTVFLVEPDTPVGEEHLDEQASRIPDVELLMKPLVQPDPGAQALHEHQMLFTLNDVSFEELLPRWVALHNKFAPVCQLLFGLRYLDPGYVQTKFSIAVTAAEALHRRLDPPPPIPSEEFAELRERLLEVTPKEHRSRIGDMLRHNQPTLKERLVDLVERVGEEEVERFLPDVPLWAKAVKDTRNRFAHHDPEQDTREFPAEGVLALAETTAAVTTLCLLQQLGLQQAVIQRVVERHAHYRWLARLARELPDWMASATRG